MEAGPAVLFYLIRQEHLNVMEQDQLLCYSIRLQHLMAVVHCAPGASSRAWDGGSFCA